MVISRAAARLPNWVLELTANALVLLVFVAISQTNLPLFHALAELITVMFAVGAYFASWIAARFSTSPYLAALGGTYVVVAVLTTLHILAYPGLNLLAGSAGEVSERLWVASRMFHALSLLALPLFFGRRFQPRLALLVYLVFGGLLLLGATNARVLPLLYAERVGPTSLARDLAWVPFGLFTLAGLHLSLRRAALEPKFFRFLMASIAASLLASLAGALQTGGHVGVLAHLGNLASIYLAYKAVVETGFVQPYGLLFHDLQQAEQANRRQKELLEAILETDPAALAVVAGEDLVVVLANQAYRDLTPNPRIDPLGRRMEEIWAGSPDLDNRLSVLRQALTGRKTLTIETQPLISPNGEERYYRIHYLPTGWEDEPAVLSVLWDVTRLERERQHEQAAAKFSFSLSQELESLLDALPAALFISLDRDSSRIVGNQVAQRMLGLSPESGLRELPPYDPIRLAPPGAKGSLPPFEELPMVRAARTGEAQTDLDFVMPMANGEVRHFTGSVHPLRDEHGQPNGAIAVLTDITERVLARERLTASEARFRSLVGSINDVIFTLDTDLRVTSVYGTPLRPLAIDPHAYVGRPVQEAIERIGGAEEPFRRALTGKSVTVEWQLEGVGMPLYYQIVLSPVIEGGQVTGLVGVGRDVTTQHLAEMELARSNRELDQFAHVVSHDLQEPLRKVRYFGQALKDDYGDRLDERGVDYLSRMLSAGARMQDMINDLLTYSRITTRPQPFAPVDLTRVAESVLADMDARLLSEKAQVSVEPLPTVEADPMQMRQLMQNLISNAIKYHRPGEPARVHVWSLPDVEPGWAALVVRDEGIGFDPGQAERIFQPFERLVGRSQYEGSGVGLAICKKIVERHGGTIQADARPGEGATFTVRLPLRQPGQPSDRGPAAG